MKTVIVIQAILGLSCSVMVVVGFAQSDGYLMALGAYSVYVLRAAKENNR